MSNGEDYDSDAAPEEFTAEQGLEQEKELEKIQRENKARIVRERKERRKLWAQKKTPRKRPSQEVESVQVVTETEDQKESVASAGMLPKDIVELLAARDREKQVFLSDSEDEKTEEKGSSKKKKKSRSSGVDTVVLNEIPSAQCVQNSLDFLKKRKMQVSRSSAVLKNSNQALRLLSTSGLLK
ncbi:hypothetical protein UlMin_039425 [Ulmus minor]